MNTSAGQTTPTVHLQKSTDAALSCHICQNPSRNKTHLVREMMLGLRDEFQYLECAACGCLQLVNSPADMARYYPSDYTAFREVEESQSALTRVRNHLRKRRNRGIHNPRNSLDRMLARRFKYLQLEAFAKLGIRPQARILDVGCGSGTVLMDLRELGYKNLHGVDRFIPRSMEYKNGVKVMRGALEDLSETRWDVIMFHHSFEHMPDPTAVLRLTCDMLNSGGRCLVRIPVIGWAWRHYGVHWGQLDAPRHLFLHTTRSFQLLANSVGLDIQHINYDSNEFQFWVSELYSRNIPLAALPNLNPSGKFSKLQLRKYRTQAARLNRESQGDAAVFDLVKR